MRFGRTNPHCANCGDERGGSFGHETYECKYVKGMTVVELADTMPDDKANVYLDFVINAYLEKQLKGD